MNARKSSKIQFEIFLKKFTIVILGLSIVTVILSLLSNNNFIFGLLLLIDIVTIIIVSGIGITKIIKNTIKS